MKLDDKAIQIQAHICSSSFKKERGYRKTLKTNRKKTFAEERVKSTYIYIYFFLIEIELSYLKIYFLDDSGSL